LDTEYGLLTAIKSKSHLICFLRFALLLIYSLSYIYLYLNLLCTLVISQIYLCYFKICLAIRYHSTS